MRRARRARPRGDTLGVLLIAAAFVVLFALAAAGFYLRPPPTDEETLCRTDEPVAAHTYILVDATDRLEPRHRRKLTAVVNEERTRLPRYGRFTLAQLRADRPQEPRILFSLCNPGDGRDANPLYQNTRRAQEKWDEAFGDALDRAVRRAGGGRGANTSPLLAGVRAAAADPDFSNAIAARRFVLVSDLLEFTPGGLSLYDETASFDGWRTADPTGPAELERVAVRIVPLDRPDDAAAQARARDLFWPRYFDAAGAARVTFDPTP